MFKRFSKLFLVLVLILTTVIPVSAQPDYTLNPIIPGHDNLNPNYTLKPIVQEYDSRNPNSDQIVPLSPNGIPIKITPKSDGSGVKVYVGNIGIDSLDRVDVTVEATGHAPVKQTSKVLPLIGKTFDFDLPMIKSKTVYDVVVLIVDGSGVRYEVGQAKLEYTESMLVDVWNKGTYSSRGHSLEDHFDRHRKEVSSPNIVDYLDQALEYRYEIFDEGTGNMTITYPNGKIPSTRYKHKIDRRFIILVNSNQEILSFGR